MFISKVIIVRLLSIAFVFIFAWTVWQRIDAIIDNYQRMYNLSLLQQVAREWQQEFDARLNDRFKNDLGDFDKIKETKDKDIDKKREKFNKDAVIEQHNKPVPQVAHEYTQGYYHGLINFFIRSGFASVFVGVILFGGCLVAIRIIFQKITEKRINNFLRKRGIG